MKQRQSYRLTTQISQNVNNTTVHILHGSYCSHITYKPNCFLILIIIMCNVWLWSTLDLEPYRYFVQYSVETLHFVCTDYVSHRELAAPPFYYVVNDVGGGAVQSACPLWPLHFYILMAGNLCLCMIAQVAVLYKFSIYYDLCAGNG
jgi:hypothetical protein